MKQLKIDDITVYIEKKKMKNIRIRILPPEGRIVVSGPKGISDKAIIEVIQSKRDWILKHREKIQLNPNHREINYDPGDFIDVLGERLQLEIHNSGQKKHCFRAEDKVILLTSVSSTRLEKEQLIYSMYRDILREEIPPLIRKWEGFIGVQCKEWRIKNMKTRWGTCNIKDHRIWLNLQLAKKNRACLEYVVVHELVHLLEAKHNSRFKGFMDEFLPDWRERKKYLNEK